MSPFALLKRLVKKSFNLFYLDISTINKEIKNLTFDEIYKLKIRRNPVIFDVGANQGQSIERFKKLFEEPIIHAFEPIKNEFIKLQRKYSNDKNVFLNNCAVGSKSELKDFSIHAKTGTSSFLELKKGTEWLEKRSKQANTTEKGYIKEVIKVEIITLDNYCTENNINEIDIIKIDTQGYEDKVLEGCQNIFKNERVSCIESEIMFDDVYEEYFTFTDYEKLLIPNNFRFVGINLSNNNLFSGMVFWADVLYFNKNKFGI